ncbi:hypothetical protein N0B44_15555 [Roseibacterium beibuensis]|uniref:Tip attachment protein J domain-containing protein n=1 Tax=[Roseibacterium] beibuensis TaxID=1193142 RepID=A0ABP9LBT7_9RHOB|nr:hypothetical protein [Roseibacterium beibuensis]MCS6624335.1 hypothetical protein [Roseibacterium beibuensis]
MPQFIATTIVSAIGLTGATAAIATAAIQIGAGLALSAFAASQQQDSGFKPADGRVLYTDPIGPRLKPYGTTLLGGQVVFARAGGAGSDPADSGTSSTEEGKYLHRIIVHGQGPATRVLRYMLDGQQRNVDDLGRVMIRRYTNGTPNGGCRVRIHTHLGAVPETPFIGVVDAAPEWGSAHRLDGLFATYIRLQQQSADKQQEAYPSGPTSLQLLAEGAPLLDPRTGAVAFSENAALVIADWIEGPDGFGLGEIINRDDLIAAANECDVLRPLISGGSARKWRLCGQASMAEQPMNALAQMLDACAGDLRLRPDGGIGLKLGGDPEPVWTLTDDDLLEVLELDDGPDALQRYTTRPASYIDEAQEYAEADIEPWVSETELARLGGEVVGPSLDLPFAPNHAQARHAAKIATARDNPPERAKLRFKMSALPALYEPTVALDIQVLGLTGRWRIEPVSLDPVTLAVTLSLSKIEGRPQDWRVSEEGSVQALPPAVPEEFRPPAAPQDVQAYGNGTGGDAGVFVVFEGPIENDVQHYVATSPAGAETWTAATLDAGGLSAREGLLTAGALYDVAVIAAKSAIYDPTDATVTAVVIENVEALETDPAPSAPFDLSITDAGSGTAVVAVTAPASPMLRTIEILRGGLVIETVRVTPGARIEIADACGTGTFNWTARAVSLSGVVGDATAAITQTIS